MDKTRNVAVDRSWNALTWKGLFKKSRHALEEFSRRRRLEILASLPAWIAAPEDVIISKLKYYREGESPKHLTDIRGILANTSVDKNYLESWLKALELEKYMVLV